MSSESKIIILYPRTYNQRGVESLHSVEGLTHDGRLVNIKLRVQGNVRMAEATPSISRFAKRDIRESKLSCLASEDNGPNNPSGILVFTDCEEDTNNRKSVVSYISRWAQILRSGHNAGAYGSSGDLPFIGLGRLFIDKETKKIKEARESIQFLETSKPDEWEDAVQRNEAVINDHKSFDFYFLGYLYDKEQLFDKGDEESMLSFMNEKLGEHENTPEIGFMMRVELPSGHVVHEIHNEIFPIYQKVYMRYQHAAEMFQHFRNLNPDLDGFGEFKYRVMPIVRFAGKKVFKDGIRSQSDFLKLEETYFINGEPRIFPVAVKIDRLENKERLLNKIHLLGPSVGSPLQLSQSGVASLDVRNANEEVADKQVEAVSSGLSITANPGFAQWYKPKPVEIKSLDGMDERFLSTPSSEAGSPVDEESKKTDRQESATLLSESAYVLTDNIFDTEIAVNADLHGGVEQDNLIIHHKEHPLSIIDQADYKDGVHDQQQKGSLINESMGNVTLDDDLDKLFSESDDYEDPIESDDMEDGETLFGRESDISFDKIKLDPFMEEAILTIDKGDGDCISKEEFQTDTADVVDAMDEAVSGEILSPWLDDEELIAKLDEAPDAYSEETEADQPTTSPSEADNIVTSSGDVSLSEDKTEVALKSEKPPKKGGLADFIKKRGLL